MDTNVKNIKDTNVNDTTENGYITTFNRGAYVAECYLSYILDGIHENFSSPYFPVLQSYRFDIPKEATNITFLAAVTFDFSESDVIFRKQYDTPPKVCFALYGTLFNTSYEEIKCPFGVGGGGNTTPPDTVPPVILPPYCNPWCKPCCNCCCKPCCNPGYNNPQNNPYTIFQPNNLNYNPYNY